MTNLKFAKTPKTFQGKLANDCSKMEIENRNFNDLFLTNSELI